MRPVGNYSRSKDLNQNQEEVNLKRATGQSESKVLPKKFIDPIIIGIELTASNLIAKIGRELKFQV